MEVSMSHPRRSPVLALLSGLLILLGAACSDSEPDPAGPATSADSADDSADGSVAGDDEGAVDQATGPVTVTADNGELTFTDTPAAIVSLSPSLTEILFAIGADDQVIAVDSSSDYPEGTPITDLSGFQPNVEAIGALEPDLVMLARDRDGVVGALEAAGIPVLLLESPSGVEEVYTQIETIGQVTRHVQTADDLVTAMQDDIDSLVLAVPLRDEPLDYFYELSGDYHSLTSDTFVGSVMESIGLVNIADGVDGAAGTFPQLSAEHVLGADPDLVFVAHADGSVPTPDELAGRPGWADLGAVQSGNVVFLDPDIASRWGPRLVELVISIVDATSAVGAP
jgi:iron complex transport system substrate-binding protein